jgi:hypothetical protein
MDGGWGTEPPADAVKVSLRDFMRQPEMENDYTYDFGDDWELWLIITDIRQGSRAGPIRAWSEASGADHRRIAGRFPGFTTSSKPWPIRSIRIIRRSRNFLRTMIRRKRILALSATPSPASRTGGMRPECVLRRGRPDIDVTSERNRFVAQQRWFIRSLKSVDDL